jgi:broad specificity phosphatase PhoE
MVRLILVRHGESEGNRDRTFTQSPEVPLTIIGRQQAQATATEILRNFSARRVVSSPFARARQTAEIIAESLGVPIAFESAICEQSFGVFAGQPYESLLSDAAYHEGPRWAWRPQGGESLLDVAQRAVPAVQRIAAGARDEDIVVVSHGGVMLALCAHAAGTWDGLNVTPNCGIVVVEVVDGKWIRCPG